MSPTESSSDDLSVYSFDCESHARELSESLSRYTDDTASSYQQAPTYDPMERKLRSQDLRAELVALSLTTVPVGFLIDRFKAIDKECCSLGFPISEIDLVVIFRSKFFGHPVFDDLVESLIHQPIYYVMEKFRERQILVEQYGSGLFHPSNFLACIIADEIRAHRFVPMVPVMQDYTLPPNYLEALGPGLAPSFPIEGPSGGGPSIPEHESFPQDSDSSFDDESMQSLSPTCCD